LSGSCSCPCGWKKFWEIWMYTKWRNRLQYLVRGLTWNCNLFVRADSCEWRLLSCVVLCYARDYECKWATGIPLLQDRADTSTK
jgi:hypothetical protein